MKKLVIEIDVENDAFVDSGESEIVRILMRYCSYVREMENVPKNYNFLDYNGNTVGTAKVLEK